MSLDNILWSIRPRSGKIKLVWPRYLCGYGIRHASSLFYQTFRKISRLLLFSRIHLKAMSLAVCCQRRRGDTQAGIWGSAHVFIVADWSQIGSRKDTGIRLFDAKPLYKQVVQRTIAPSTGRDQKMRTLPERFWNIDPLHDTLHHATKFQAVLWFPQIS